MNGLLNFDDIIKSSSTRNKPSLKWGDKFIHEGSDPINQQLWKNFIRGIAETNGPVLFDRLRLVDLRNQTEKIIIHSLKKLAPIECVKNKTSYGFSNLILEVLEER